MNGRRPISGSFASKTIAVLLSFICFWMMAACAAGFVFLVDSNAYDSTTEFIDSDEAMESANEFAYRAATYYADSRMNNDAEDYLYGPQKTNLRIRIWSADDSTLLYTNCSDPWNTDASVIYFYGMFPEKLPDGTVYEAYVNSNTTEGYENDPNAELLYVVRYYLPRHMTVRDGFYYRNLLFTTLYPYRYLLFAIIGMFLLFWFLCIAFLCRGAGRSPKDTELHLSWIDRIPLDLLAGVMTVIAFPLVIFLWSEPLIYMQFSSLTPIGDAISALIPVFLSLSALYFLALILVLTFATRWKTGKWYQNTIIAFLFTSVVRTASMIPYSLRTLAVYAVFWILFIWFWSGSRPRMIHLLMIILGGISLIWITHQIHQLTTIVSSLSKGDLDYEVDDKLMFGPFRKISEDLQQVRSGIAIAVDKQMRSERLKTELITNVSHDIKTPLTSIVNYVDLLQKPHTPEEEEQYLSVLSRNSSRLKKLTEDLVEASKASSGNIEAHIVPTAVREVIEQSLAEYEDKLEAASLQVVTGYSEDDLSVLADGRLLWRILSNLLSNCVKYAQKDTRIYVNAKKEENHRISIEIKNTSRDPLNVDAEELMERFVRGDRSRNTEGSGLGLNIARSLTEIQHGEFSLAIDGDLFKAKVTLPEYVPDEQTSQPSNNRE